MSTSHGSVKLTRAQLRAIQAQRAIAQLPAKRRSKILRAVPKQPNKKLCDSLSLTLPNPPSSRIAWRLMKGRIVTSPEQRAYKALVAKESSGFWVGAGEISVFLDWFRAKRSGDLDNRAKVILDALQGVAYANDSQIVELHMRRFEDKKHPRVEVVVEMMPETRVSR